jgi:hypothetical protein
LSATPWTLTVRAGSRVRHERFETLDAAVDALRGELDSLTPDAPREEVSFFARRIEPVAQVSARLELAGPRGVRGGVDLRGDGSAEAYTGRLRRSVVERGRGESAADALLRTLAT